MFKKLNISFFIALMISLMIFTNVQAAVYNVNNAVDWDNALGSVVAGDTINVNVDVSSDHALPNAAYTINGNGYNITTTGGLSVPANTMINNLLIDSRTIYTNNTIGGNGGAVNISSATRTINNGATFSNNTAANGGAIYSTPDSIFTINNGATFSGNTADSPGGYGGAIFNTSNSPFTINGGVTFTGNHTVSGNGGAIYNDTSTFTINGGATFTGNYIGSGNGGAICNAWGGTFTINNGATFSNNTANSGNGGAISNILFSTFKINDGATFSNNTANLGNGGAIYSEDSTTTLIADTNNVEFTGNTVNGADNAIYLANTSTLNLNANASTNANVTFNDGISSGSADNIININATNAINGTIRADAPTSGEIILNADMSGFSGAGNHVNLYNGTLTLGTDGVFFNNIDFMAMPGSILNLMNGKVDTISLNSADIDNMNMKIDVDMTALTADNINATTVGAHNDITISKIGVINESASSGTVTVDPDNKFDITLGSGANTATGNVYNYNVTNNGNGSLSLAVVSSSPTSYNPVVYSSPVTQQSAYLNTISTNNIAINRADEVMTYMDNIKTATGVDYDLVNKVAMAGIGKEPKYSTLYGRLEKGSIWFRPFSNLEQIRINTLSNKVRSASYGIIAGYDTPLKKLRRGFKGMTTVYGGFGGAAQRYDSIDSYQNGGFLGILGALYRGNFYTTLSTSFGGYGVIENIENYGASPYGMLASSVTSKTGYNLHLPKHITIQLNNQIAYSLIATQDYTNAQSTRIKSSPLNIIQLMPGVKLTTNIKDWQPYLGVNMIFNPLNSSKVTANDIVLPDSNLGSYVEYGFGIQRQNENESGGFLQAMVRNGSRTGVSLQFGLKFPVGKKETQLCNF